MGGCADAEQDTSSWSQGCRHEGASNSSAPRDVLLVLCHFPALSPRTTKLGLSGDVEVRNEQMFVMF